MYWVDDEHEKSYKAMIDLDETYEGDNERKALFYILSGYPKFRKCIKGLYNFELRQIELNNFQEHNTYSSGENKLIELAYNLYNGYGYNSPADLFSGLDYELFMVAIEALKIRFDYLKKPKDIEELLKESGYKKCE